MANDSFKINFVTLILIISFNVFAEEKYSISGKIIFFKRSEGNILISSDCRKCLAYKAYEKVKEENLHIEKKFKINGANIGALQCEINLGGEIYTGINQKQKNRRLNFCVFKDGSMIHARALNNTK
tara:strand:+ start:6699 stop:7076 length:378 start_codon:yes stop_codon:yes gene_type:complete